MRCGFPGTREAAHSAGERADGRGRVAHCRGGRLFVLWGRLWISCAGREEEVDLFGAPAWTAQRDAGPAVVWCQSGRRGSVEASELSQRAPFALAL
jgi:hypothetical protein